MIEVDRVNDPKKKRVQMVLCWNFIETTPTLPKWLLCLKHVDHCARDLGCSVNHELINQLMKFGTPWAGGLLIRGRALPKDHFFQSFNWIQSEPGSKTPVTSMRLPAGSGTWLIHAYRFILCCQVLCVFSTGCHHDLVFFGLRHGILRLPEKHSCCDWREMGLSAGSAGVDKASWSARPYGAAPCLLFPAWVWTEHLAHGRRQSKICQKEGKEREKEQWTPAKSLRWWRSVRAKCAWSILIYLEHDVSNVGHSEVLCAQSNSFFAFCSEQQFPRWSSKPVGKTRPIHINLSHTKCSKTRYKPIHRETDPKLKTIENLLYRIYWCNYGLKDMLTDPISTTRKVLRFWTLHRLPPTGPARTCTIARCKMPTPSVAVDAGWWFGTWLLFSISYMGCHPSHWRTHIFQDG